MKKRAASKSDTSKIIMLPLDSICTDGGTQIRVAVDRAVVEEYAAALKAGAKFPPGIAFNDGGPHYWLADGIQRHEAHVLAGRKKMRCEIRQGGLRDAIFYAVGANATHGQRRTNEDKNNAVRTLLGDPEWSKLSDHQIARACGVSQPFVSGVRKGRGDNGYQVPPPATDVTGIDSPLKWHGGKQPLARRIVALMPPHVTYVEPYAGGLSPLLMKQPADANEIANDIHGGLMNFWTVLREPALFKQFQRFAQATPFSEKLWRECLSQIDADADDPARRAWRFFVVCRQSLAGRMKNFSPLSITRTRQNMNEQAAAWLSAVDGLPQVHARLKRVALLNRDALQVIEQHDAPETLFYCDPTYTPDSRATPEVYENEMTIAQHKRLLELLKGCQGKVILSGYLNPLYERALAGWPRIDVDRANSAAGGDTKRRMTESLWCNFSLPATATKAAA